MKRYILSCKLLDELVLSERSATAGSHRSLDYLPGSAFLGAVAGHIYSELTTEEAFMVFHSGAVRFCNAQPVRDGQLGRAMPLALHERKGDPAQRHRPKPAQLYNFAHPDGQARCREAGAQPRQLRAGWLTEDGAVLQPARNYRMKTAVDSSSGQAAEGQLFGYESLQPGLKFQGEVHFDNQISDALRNKVIDVLNGTVRLGRSRSAQYGRVACKAVAADQPDIAAGEGQRLVLWLQSDMACSNDGVPVFAPSLGDLGLKASGRLDISASFIRTRSYAPYNAHRKLPDLERQVISAGSVLVYHLASSLCSEDAARLTEGLGNWRESGLGQVIANPLLLEGVHPRFLQASVSDAQNQAAPITLPKHPLVGWLLAASGHADADTRLKSWVENKLIEWALRQESCRRFAGFSQFELAGPNRTQWGAVQEKAKLARNNKAQLETLLFAEDAGMCRGGEDWERPLGSGWSEQKDLRTWLISCLNEDEASNNVGLAVARLAGAIQKSLIEGSWSRLLEAQQGERNAG